MNTHLEIFRRSGAFILLVIVCYVFGKHYILTNILPHTEHKAILISKKKWVSNDGVDMVYYFKYIINNKEYINETSVSMQSDYINKNIGDEVIVKVSNFDNRISLINNNMKRLEIILVSLICISGFVAHLCYKINR